MLASQACQAIPRLAKILRNGKFGKNHLLSLCQAALEIKKQAMTQHRPLA